MAKAALVVLADTNSREGLGRIANALVTAQEFDQAGDEVTIVFDGAGTNGSLCSLTPSTSTTGASRR
jgi:hypothetical protein